MKMRPFRSEKESMQVINGKIIAQVLTTVIHVVNTVIYLRLFAYNYILAHSHNSQCDPNNHISSCEITPTRPDHASTS